MRVYRIRGPGCEVLEHVAVFLTGCVPERQEVGKAIPVGGNRKQKGAIFGESQLESIRSRGGGIKNANGDLKKCNAKKMQTNCKKMQKNASKMQANFFLDF